jgi:hypothetical protein
MRKKKTPTKKQRKETIFVSIASYRDEELIPTLDNMLAQAQSPKDLKICICWQHDDSEDLSKYENDSRFLIIDVPHKEAKGVCWARNLIQKQFEGEDYILQLDSHHRFIKNWDSTLKRKLNSLKKKGVEKPILSSYLPGYDPNNDPKGRVKENWRLCFDRFMPEGAVFLRPAHIPAGKKGMERGSFISGHMVFADGHYYENVMYDPKLYFHGEETSLGVRAFTHGYDIYALDKPIMWHFYERSGSVRHWDDSTEWNDLNLESFRRFKSLLGVDETPLEDLGQYGLGTERSLEDFEKFAGINFKERKVHKDTKAQNPPPIDGENSDEYLNDFKYCIDLHESWVAEKDCDFFAITFTDEEGEEIGRYDADEPEVVNLINSAASGDGWIRIWREFEAVSVPKTWVVWPRSKTKGFLERIEKDLPTS